MAHEFESGVFAREPAWHKLGVVVPNVLTSEEAIRLANLDWTVRKEPIYAKVGDTFYNVPGQFSTVRDSDNRPLGIVGNRYHVVQNREAFDFFDAVVGEKAAMYETAGSLRNGQKVFITAKLPGHIRVTRDDVIEKYILLSLTHDGSGCIRMLPTTVRTVCMNTLTAALRAGQNEGISIRHTRNATKKINEARVALGIAVEQFKRMEGTFKRLLALKLTDDDRKRFVADLFPVNEDKEVSVRTTNNREAVLKLMETGRGQVGDVRGTGYAALSAVTEYADWYRGTRVTKGQSEADLRADSILFGSGAALKHKALHLLEQRLAA